MAERRYVRLDRKVALITGVGSELGEAMAKLFAEEGAGWLLPILMTRAQTGSKTK